MSNDLYSQVSNDLYCQVSNDLYCQMSNDLYSQTTNDLFHRAIKLTSKNNQVSHYTLVTFSDAGRRMPSDGKSSP